MTAYFTLLPRSILRISGEDRLEFLQGLVSNDIHFLAERSVLWAALLTPQGKYLFDFFVIAHNGAQGPEILLECESPQLDKLAKRLAMYRLRARVDISPLPGWAVFALPDGMAELGEAAAMGFCRRHVVSGSAP